MYSLARKTVMAVNEKRKKGEKTKTGHGFVLNPLFEYPSARLKKESGRKVLKKSFLRDLRRLIENTGEISVEIRYSADGDVEMTLYPHFVVQITDDSSIPMMDLPTISISGWADRYTLTYSETAALFYAISRTARVQDGESNINFVNTISHCKSIAKKLWKNMR